MIKKLSKKKFREFLIEEESLKKIKSKKVKIKTQNNAIPDIIVLTNRKIENDDNKLFRTAERIKEICNKRKINCYIVFVEDAHIIKHSDGYHTIHNYNDDKGFPIIYGQTVAIIRGSIGKYRSTMDLVSQLEKIGIFCINHRETMETCSDKYRTILKLADSGLPSPKTALLQSEDTIDLAIESVGGKFPLIVKTLTGSKGIGVLFTESLRSLKSFLQMVWKINPDEELILQQFIETDHDLRVHVLGDEVIAAMKRYVIPGDFRSNFSLGGKVEEVKLNIEEEELCIKAAKAVRASWAGVDFLKDKKGNIYIIEINSSPGTTGIEKATNENIVSMVVDFAINRDNWSLKAQECGWIEMLEIDGVGEFKAKFDTGNGSLCVLHADKYKIDKKIVQWKIGKNSFRVPLKEFKNIHVGGLRDFTERRPVIELDIIFDGILYSKIDFTLDDRSGRTPILLNRKFLRKANVMVNPREKYLITVKK